MLVNTKARVGVFSIALGAYLPQFPSLVPEFEAQYEAFKKTIPDTVEIIDGGMVTTKEQSMEAGDKFRAADVDLVCLGILAKNMPKHLAGYYLLNSYKPSISIYIFKKDTLSYWQGVFCLVMYCQSPMTDGGQEYGFLLLCPVREC